MPHESSELVSKGVCPDCGSTDACCLYDDGHTHCFSCGVTVQGAGSHAPTWTTRVAGLSALAELPSGLPNRKLGADILHRWRVGTTDNGRLLCFPYFDELGSMVAQKCRTADKEFHVKGSLKTALLFGQQLWRDGGKRVIITEGEFDAISVDLALGTRWPVVSIPNGAQGARKALSAQLPWLNKFEEVVLCFDQDDPGREAIDDCVGLFPPGKAFIAVLPAKDASDMIQADQSALLVKALWDAKPYRPDGIVTVTDIMADCLKTPETGLPWCLPELSKATYGRRYGEAVALGAGTGVGKTTLLTQQIVYDIQELKLDVAVFAFEQSPAETVKRVCGMMDRRTYYIPDSGWTQDELVQSLSRLQNGPQLYLYDHFGDADWDIVRERIRFLRHQHGVRIFYLDHLTALASGEGERERLETIMKELGSLVKELDCWMLFVSHLSTPEGKSHEEGGRVTIRNFKGSRTIGFWSSFMIGMERDQQADDPATANITTLRILKDRYTGTSTGDTFNLNYSPDTGKYFKALEYTPVVNADDPF